SHAKDNRGRRKSRERNADALECADDHVAVVDKEIEYLADNVADNAEYVLDDTTERFERALDAVNELDDRLGGVRTEVVGDRRLERAERRLEYSCALLV